ncbi:sphingolipid C4-monooxygenase [Malassezia cuniculi]|uniref:Sphingolipid C4-monooxygenase n=1 Tax=Malassezia cuniculi TaxID=948313 RepID=A0AAF0EP73_9BASI|nr:sphingolipid C4-monooxygenase [Malassezia cuniculi]
MLPPSSDPGAFRLAANNVAPYYSDSPRAVSFLSDKYTSLAIPVVVYWVSSLSFHALDVLRPAFSEKYRIHEPAEVTRRNRVSMTRVIVMVILQHILQTVLGIIVLTDTAHNTTRRLDVDPIGDVLRLGDRIQRVIGYAAPSLATTDIATRVAIAMYWWMIPWMQLWFGCLVMDTWQYMLHRLMHEVRFLYRMLHSHHHRLYVPYAFGALYNHPLEGLLLDTVSAALAQEASRMNMRVTMVFFSMSTFKTVCDHCGYNFPWYYNPLHLFFPNSAAYHDVHHQSKGLRFNYSQPFFVHFDTLFNTRVDPDDFYAQISESAPEEVPASRGGLRRRNVGTDEKKQQQRPATTTASAARAVKPSTGKNSHYVLASRAGIVRALVVLIVPLVYYLGAPYSMLT